MQDIVANHWNFLVPLLSLSSTDRIVVVGAGFGWGIEKLEDLTNCTAIGVDISDYINDTKGISEAAEVDAAIISAGYLTTEGHGLEVRNAVLAQPRTKTTILKEDMFTNKSRNSVKQALGNQNPTWIITEDMISDFSDAEILEWKTEVDKLGVPICHIVRENFGLNQKTLEEWNVLTGHTVISVGDYRRVG